MADGLDFSDIASEADLEGFAPPVNGLYHVIVEGIDEEKVANSMLVEFRVLAGTVASMAGRQFSGKFTFPRADMSDHGAFCTKRLGKLILATGLATPAELCGKTLTPDWSMLPGKQLVVKKKDCKPTEEGRVYQDVDGMSMWHVNAAEVAEVPKNNEILAMIPGVAAAPVAQAQPAGTPVAPAAPAVDAWNKV